VMSGERLTDDVIGDYARICARAPAVAFCVDVAHSIAVAKRFQQHGLRAGHVDGSTGREERRRLIAGLGNGQLDVLTNCGIISEGLDVPVIGAAILLRPTRSLGLHLQQIGRALRPAPGKNRALILDFAGNVPRLGFPDEPRAWSLSGNKDNRPGGRAIASCRCPACGTLSPSGTLQCDACGTQLRPRQPAPAPQQHVSHGALATMPYRQALEWAGSSIGRLKMVAAARGYKPGWVWVQVREFRTSKPGTAA
jgi:DNA repair protein RadD